MRKQLDGVLHLQRTRANVDCKPNNRNGQKNISNAYRSGNRKLSENRLILPHGSAIMKKDSGASAPDDRKVIVTEDVS